MKEGSKVPRRGNVPKREVLPDPIYNSVLVTKLVNSIMLDGKKGVAQKVVYGAFDIIKEKTEKDPLDVFTTALENIMPCLEVKARRVGGATYQVPMEVNSRRATTLAIRWIVDFSRKRKEHTMKQRLAAAQPELLRVTVDGKPVTFPISLYQVSGCTMAPLRQMAQALGYTFDYDGSSGTAVCARGPATISVRAASTQATVNGKTTNWLAVPAELRGGIFCVPVRFFAEAAGADVTWDAAGQPFYLTTAIQEG